MLELQKLGARPWSGEVVPGSPMGCRLGGGGWLLASELRMEISGWVAW